MNSSRDGALRVKAPLTTRISSLKQLKKLMKSNFLQRVWPFGGFFEQNSIRKKQDVSCMIRIMHDTLRVNGGVFMRYKREFTKENFEELMEMPYGRMVKAAAIVQLIEEEGVTPEMIEKWGRINEKDGRMHLVFEVEDITEGVNGSEFYTRRNVHYFSFPVSEI